MNRWVSRLLGGWSALVIGFLWLPILVVVAHSFNEGRFLSRWDGFGTRWYSSVWESEAIRRTLRTSLEAASLAAVVAVVLGSLAGLALARRAGRWSRPFTVVVLLVLVTPEIVDAIAVLIWFVRIDLDHGLARLVVGHSVFGTALVTLIVRARLDGISEELEEAAADLGATPLSVFRHVTLPLMLPAVVAGGLLAFTFSVDDVVVSSFVSTAGRSTFPVYVFSATRTGLRGDLAAAATLVLVLTFVVLVLAAALLRRGGSSSTDVVETIAGG